MAKISTWSTTAASNNSASPDGWPEGMPPSGVNNSAREMMAQLRTQHESAQWIDFGYTPVFVAATQFRFAGVDYTTEYHVGRRVKVSDVGTIYGTITASVFSTDTTVTVVIDDGTAITVGGLTAVALGAVTSNNSATPGVRVSNTDTTAKDLSTKLLAGSGINLTIDNAGSAETYTIAAGGSASSTTTPGTGVVTDVTAGTAPVTEGDSSGNAATNTTNFNAMIANSSGTFRFPAGIFWFDTILADVPATLVGEGEEATILKFAASGAEHAFVNSGDDGAGDFKNPLVIQEMTLQGTATQTAGWHGLYSVAPCVTNNVTITGFTNAGFCEDNVSVSETSAQGLHTNLSVIANGQGHLIQDTGTGTVKFNTFVNPRMSQNSGKGFECTATDAIGVQYIGGVVGQNDDEGYVISSGTYGFRVYGTAIHGNNQVTGTYDFNIGAVNYGFFDLTYLTGGGSGATYINTGSTVRTVVHHNGTDYGDVNIINVPSAGDTPFYVLEDDYGAVGDGTTDDSGAFEAADAVGGIVICKSDIYAINTNCDLGSVSGDRRTRFVGHVRDFQTGSNTGWTTMRCDVAGDHAITMSSASNAHVVFEGFHFKNYATQTAGNHMVSIQGGGAFEHCKFEDGTNTAISIIDHPSTSNRSTWGVWLRDVYIIDCGDGIVIDNTTSETYIDFNRVEVWSCNGDGISVTLDHSGTWHSSVRMRDIEVHGCNGNQLDLISGDYMSITGVTLTNRGTYNPDENLGIAANVFHSTIEIDHAVSDAKWNIGASDNTNRITIEGQYFGDGVQTDTSTAWSFDWGIVSRTVLCNNASAIAVTFEPDSTDDFPVGTFVNLCQYGAGTVTATAGAGVTIRGTAATGAQYDTIKVTKIANDEWLVS